MAVPVVTFVGPATLTADDPIVVEVTSTPALASGVIAFTFPGIPTTELAFAGVSFTENYVRDSRAEAITDGFRYSLFRRGGWPDTPTVMVVAQNTSEERSIANHAFAPIVGLAETGVTSLVPMASAAAPEPSGSGATYRDLEWFLSLYDRIIADDYLQPMRDGNGPGYEMFRAFARTMSRCSLAVRRFEDSATLLFSEGPAFSTGVVEFYRQSFGAGAVTVLPGTVVSDELGRAFFTTAPAVFGSTDLGPVTAPVRAMLPSYQWDLPGEQLAPSGQRIPGPINLVLRLLESPDFADPSILVRNVSATAGGREGALDLNALDRGIFRAPGEGDDSLRFRARALPDVVSPAAIRRLVASYLEAYLVDWEYIETARVEYQTFYDAEDGGLGYDPNLFYYDSAENDPPFRNRWLDSNEDTRCFLIVMEPIEPIEDVGGIYDDTATVLDNLESSHHLGGRAVSAFDFVDGDGDYLQLAYDGGDDALDAVYAGLWNAIQRARPAGITVGFVLRERGS